MAHPKVEFHPEAAAEARAAREWYEHRNPQAADAFMVELDSAIDQIGRAPAMWPEYLYDTRQYILRRFPYVAVYRESGNTIQIIAIAHARRKPGYWSERQFE